jgi:uncharacterized glyoxalase superfamily protein PhnB
MGGMTSRDKTVWPSLRARDAHQLITFLVEVFGFEQKARYGEGDVVQHCQLNWPEGGGVMLGSVRDEAGNPWNVPPGSSGAYVATDHVDEIYQRVLTSGATIVRELNDTDYGSHEFACRDPEGNLWSFGTYRGEP